MVSVGMLRCWAISGGRVRWVLPVSINTMQFKPSSIHLNFNVFGQNDHLLPGVKVRNMSLQFHLGFPPPQYDLDSNQNLWVILTHYHQKEFPSIAFVPRNK